MQLVASTTRKLKSLNVLTSPGHLFYDPSWIVLGVNNLCNLHCKMCDVGVKYNKSNFYENLMGSRPLNMPEALIFKVMNQVAEYFPKTKIGYAFTEPLIYPHLISSLKYARDLGLYTSVTTNALNLAQKADEIAAAKVNDLFVSLDGPPDVHNFIRGHKSSFERALKGIKYLVSLDQAPEISIFCVITQWNYNRLLEFVDLFSDLPIKRMGFMHTNFTTDGMAQEHNLTYGDLYPATASNMSEIDLDQMDLDALHAESVRLRAHPSAFPISFSPDLKSPHDLHNFYRKTAIIGRRCNDVFSNIMVKSNGDVIPAHGRCYNLTIGNLYNEDLKTIWNGEIISRFRKTLVRAGGLLPACARCCSAF